MRVGPRGGMLQAHWLTGVRVVPRKGALRVHWLRDVGAGLLEGALQPHWLRHWGGLREKAFRVLWLGERGGAPRTRSALIGWRGGVPEGVRRGCDHGGSRSWSRLPEGEGRQELVSRLLHLHFKDDKTKVSGDALQLTAELLKIFVVEAAVRGVRQAQAEDAPRVDVDQLEKVLPQLLLDF
ncbi:centromere protein X isoform X3 [Trachypithecus francoisi]|uniref:centromere protein X isoform X3 n=1 Tax=Trachypithecus francoisi TaxID=54180 RepID=UPI00141AE1B2|nr:centromere protein X isoform X3 [Trachypithecus francoisi]